MGRYVFRLPDVGEGTAEAEIVAWHANVGDMVAEDAPLVDMLTDKATVEMTSPVAGKLIEVGGAPGEMAAVGGPIAVFEVEGEVELRESQGLKLRELSKAEKLAEENKKLIIKKWHEHLD